MKALAVFVWTLSDAVGFGLLALFLVFMLACALVIKADAWCARVKCWWGAWRKVKLVAPSFPSTN